MTDGAHLPVDELLSETERALAAVATLGPTAARWLVAECCGLEPAELVTATDRPVTVGAVNRTRDGVRRLLAGEPLQYVLGHWQFRRLDLMVDRRVLIPRPETEQLVDLVLDWIAEHRSDSPTVRVLDLGTGSGAIGLSVAIECPTAEVTLTDASSDALDVARANLAGVGRGASRVRIHHGDWFDALPVDDRAPFDVIVSNPPYVGEGERLDPVVEDWEPAGALRSGSDGLDDIRRLTAAAATYAADDALLVLECGESHADRAAAFASTGGWASRVVADLAGRPRFVIGRRPASSPGGS